MQYEIKSSLVDRKYSNFKVKNKTYLLNLSRGFWVHLVTNRPECHSIRLVFEIQISHNYSDLIVLNCVELMIRDKNMSYLQKRSIITSF